MNIIPTQSTSRAQIVATVGPTSEAPELLKAMIEHQADVIRLNFSWGDMPQHERHIRLIRELEQKTGRSIPIIIDVPGPRIQTGASHTYSQETISALTEKDKEFIRFAIAQGVDYVALSFVGSGKDVMNARAVVQEAQGNIGLIAKIERAIAVTHIDEIIKAADAIMVARGDMGNEIPLEQIPFVQKEIIDKANRAGKPVITATQMMLSMVKNPIPTRAEVADVSLAILEGSDAVMLSDETANGTFPLETVSMMERIVVEAEKHRDMGRVFNVLSRRGGN